MSFCQRIHRSARLQCMLTYQYMLALLFTYSYYQVELHLEEIVRSVGKMDAIFYRKKWWMTCTSDKRQVRGAVNVLLLPSGFWETQKLHMLTFGVRCFVSPLVSSWSEPQFNLKDMADLQGLASGFARLLSTFSILFCLKATIPMCFLLFCWILWIKDETSLLALEVEDGSHQDCRYMPIPDSWRRSCVLSIHPGMTLPGMHLACVLSSVKSLGWGSLIIN